MVLVGDGLGELGVVGMGDGFDLGVVLFWCVGGD